jgi:hypothetical protein
LTAPAVADTLGLELPLLLQAATPMAQATVNTITPIRRIGLTRVISRRLRGNAGQLRFAHRE